MKISQKDWQNYIKRLRKVNEKAADKIAQYMRTHDYKTDKGMKALLDYSYAVATAYGEAASDLACQMYEEVAAVSKVSIPPAEPAATATYGETAKAVRGKMFDTEDPDAIGAAVGRLVKMAGVDTTMKNALRDGAEWAWIPSGDTCAFCLMLASNGWQKASKNAIRNGHAEHIHNNCDCTYQVRFDSSMQVEGYDPDALYDEYIEAGDTRQERLNSIRRKLYAKDPEKYRIQKREAYARRKALEKATQTGGKNYMPYNPDDPRDIAAAKEYRKISRRDDIDKIAKASGMSRDEVKEIRRHIFFEKHRLHESYGLLHPDYDMAVAWKRLSEGRPEERDILLLKHELLESRYEKEYNLTIAEAHKRAKKEVNWEQALMDAVGPDGEADGLL